MNLWDLNYWNTGEWQVVEERLHDLQAKKITYNPSKQNLFRALRATPFAKVVVAIYGQDPYPDHQHATGLAFSVPDGTRPLPPTAEAILQEYSADLGLPHPGHANLTKWAEQGVLLWNVIPSCQEWKSLSHEWEEWTYLTTEITKKLSDKGIVFALTGARARDYKQFIDEKPNYIIETSHPSPKGSMKSKVPFVGSRLFSRINDYLVQQGKPSINWRLE